MCVRVTTGGFRNSDNKTNNRCLYVSVCVPVYVFVCVPVYVCSSAYFGIFCIFKCPKWDCSIAYFKNQSEKNRLE